MIFVTLDIAGTPVYASRQGVSGTHWWDNVILDTPEISLNYPDSGGFIKPESGSMRLARKLFAGLPEEKIGVEMGWNRDRDDSAQFPIHSGVAMLGDVDRVSAIYSIWEPDLDVNVLTAGTDEQGEDINIPLLIGIVNHVAPQRTGTGAEYRYYKSGIYGTKGTNWHVYDDGINIDANATDHGDTFTLSPAPVGTVTMSGQGTFTSLIGLFQWGCDSSKLNKILVSSHAVDVQVDLWVTSQIKVIDLLNQVSGYCNHVFWLSYDQSTLTLNSREVANGSRTLVDYEFFRAPYSHPNPIKELKAKWKVVQAVSDHTGNHLESEEKAVVATGPEPLGESIDLTPYNQTEALVKSRLQQLVTSWQRPRASITLPIPETPINTMEEITIVDTYSTQDTTLVIKVLSQAFDVSRGTMTISGPGVVSS